MNIKNQFVKLKIILALLKLSHQYLFQLTLLYKYLDQ